ncbi:Swt1 family HEPN domain-containing protein [Mesorhizobium captivum]|uniref:Swt1 family HEPN domain-containing protein n=1 Tax=Mesorhizobium captivum TaxID=3072319 RepID=UPI002A2454E3|nr:Swt1 family HEPN domain-containing protein [Mesorhizobium sp. VK3C]MDX8447748.1 Swt1 family HEPN domain-containing protein [Mesorhizobium sp. VK3C]
MSKLDKIELFVLKSASVKASTDSITERTDPSKIDVQPEIFSSIKQFSSDVRENAERMSQYYKLFYMLENDIRKLIDDTLSEAYGPHWWDNYAPGSAKEECKFNQQREQEAAVTSRSENELDYVSFGQLGEIIRSNWVLFGGILSNQKAMGRVMFSLNTLRGPIAHCGILAEDEVDRLKLTVKDWFRLLEGPK